MNSLLLLLSALLHLSLQGEIKVVGVAGPAPCAITCAGITDSNTHWGTKFNVEKRTTVDIRDCGFTSTPVITTSLSATRDILSSLVGGTSVVYDATSTQFEIVLMGWLDVYGHNMGHFDNDDDNNIDDREWRVNWTATGFSC